MFLTFILPFTPVALCPLGLLQAVILNILHVIRQFQAKALPPLGVCHTIGKGLLKLIIGKDTAFCNAEFSVHRNHHINLRNTADGFLQYGSIGIRGYIYHQSGRELTAVGSGIGIGLTLYRLFPEMLQVSTVGADQSSSVNASLVSSLMEMVVS